MMLAILLGVSLVLVQTTVDEAITLYESGDIPGAIAALEDLVHSSDLSYDEQLRAWDRLGSSYYAMGDTENASIAYLELLKLDVHYDLSPRANPRLRDLLGRVRSENMAEAVVVSSPEGALITLDNQLMGVTPISLDGLLAGREYEIGIFANGYQTQNYTLTAQAGTTHEVSFSLVQALPADVALLSPPDTSAVEGPVEVASGQAAAGQSSTADLVNLLTSGGSIDMAALASSGALTSQRSSTGIAGAERLTNQSISTGIPVEVMSGSDIQSLMAFSDTGVTQVDPASESSIPGSSRSGEEIMAVLTEQRSSVTFIYNKHLRNDPMLMGTVTVEMVIEPSGRVSRVSIIDSNTYNPAFEVELARTIETWRFGAVDENEGSLTVQYPFTFSQ